jgi:hypothetical protein
VALIAIRRKSTIGYALIAKVLDSARASGHPARAAARKRARNAAAGDNRAIRIDNPA